MTASRGPLRFVQWSSMVALAGLIVWWVAAAATFGESGAWEAARAWGFAGWAAMALIGVAGGAGMTTVHGRPDPAFLSVMVFAMLARLGLGAALAWQVSDTGERGVSVFVTGLAAGYLPLQVFEIFWFMGRDGAQTAGGRSRG